MLHHIQSCLIPNSALNWRQDYKYMYHHRNGDTRSNFVLRPIMSTSVSMVEACNAQWRLVSLKREIESFQVPAKTVKGT